MGGGGAKREGEGKVRRLFRIYELAPFTSSCSTE